MQTAVTGLIQNRKAPAAYQAGDAATLNGQTSAEITAVMTDAVDAHIANHSNPHGLQPADINAYDKAEVDALLSGYMVNGGNFPISSYGTSTVDQNVGAVVNAGSNSVTIPAQQVIMTGRLFELAQTTVTLTANAISELYVQLVNGTPQYSVLLSTDAQLAESDTTMYIGSAETVNNTNTIRSVVRLGLYRISTTAVGSAIPVSNGYPAQAGSLAWQ